VCGDSVGPVCSPAFRRGPRRILPASSRSVGPAGVGTSANFERAAYAPRFRHLQLVVPPLPTLLELEKCHRFFLIVELRRDCGACSIARLLGEGAASSAPTLSGLCDAASGHKMSKSRKGMRRLTDASTLRSGVTAHLARCGIAPCITMGFMPYL
jgi:hypothetical protein